MKSLTRSVACAALVFNGLMATCVHAQEIKPDKARPAAAAGASSTAAPAAPQAGEKAPPALSRYVGKHPFDAVQGVTFFQHPAVRAAIIASGVDRETQKSIFFDDNVVGVVTKTRGRLLLHGYDPAGAGSTNWAILMIPDGSKAAVCYSTGVIPDKQGADWYYGGDLVFTLYETCPSEEGDMESLSNWPIGPIPG